MSDTKERSKAKFYEKEKIHKRNNEKISCMNKVQVLLKKETEFNMSKAEIIDAFKVKCMDLTTNANNPYHMEGSIEPKFGLYKISFVSEKGTKIDCSFEIKKKKREKFYKKEKVGKKNKERIECMNKTIVHLENPSEFKYDEQEILKLCEAKAFNLETKEEIPLSIKGNIYPVVGTYRIEFITDKGTKLESSFEIKKERMKYNNKKIEIDGILFDSKKEGKRYLYLKDLKDKGEISNLELQKEFVLVPKQEGERPVLYLADFYYIDKDGKEVVEDTKGWRTSDYVIKRKLMQWVHKIKITEI